MLNWRHSVACLARWIAVKRFRLAVILHAVRTPLTHWANDKRLGTDELRRANMRLMADRWDAKAPKPEDYGLPPDTAPTKHLER